MAAAQSAISGDFRRNLDADGSETATCGVLRVAVCARTLVTQPNNALGTLEPLEPLEPSRPAARPPCPPASMARNEGSRFAAIQPPRITPNLPTTSSP